MVYLDPGFALMEATTVLRAVLRKFYLAPVPGAAFPGPVAQITLRPENVELILTSR